MASLNVIQFRNIGGSLDTTTAQVAKWDAIDAGQDVTIDSEASIALHAECALVRLCPTADMRYRINGTATASTGARLPIDAVEYCGVTPGTNNTLSGIAE